MNSVPVSYSNGQLNRIAVCVKEILCPVVDDDGVLSLIFQLVVSVDI